MMERRALIQAYNRNIVLKFIVPKFLTVFNLHKSQNNALMKYNIIKELWTSSAFKKLIICHSNAYIGNIKKQHGF
jgi:hypothetical protein